MAITIVSLEELPCIIIATTETSKTIEIANKAQCSISHFPNLVKPVVFVKLLSLKIVERYPTEPKFEEVKLLED